MFCDISVVVATYEPDCIKLFQTLYSIIIQKGIMMEIIIVDDGSIEFPTLEVEQWFGERKFTDYKIICNPENRGTVLNLWSALEVAKGKYFKCISPGDYLYKENTLKNVFDYMEEHNSKICFGKASFYKYDDNNKSCKLINKANPQNVKPYKSKTQNRLKKSYYIYKDYILGASLFFQTQSLKNNLKMLCSRVIYAEDSVVFLYIAEGITIDYINNYVVWYEYGSGISTCKELEWMKKMEADIKTAYMVLSEEYPQYSYVYEILYGKGNIRAFEGKIVRFISNRIALWKEQHKKVDINNIEYFKLTEIKNL